MMFERGCRYAACLAEAAVAVAGPTRALAPSDAALDAPDAHFAAQRFVPGAEALVAIDAEQRREARRVGASGPASPAV